MSPRWYTSAVAGPSGSGKAHFVENLFVENLGEDPSRQAAPAEANRASEPIRRTRRLPSSRSLQHGPTALELLGANLPPSEAFLEDVEGACRAGCQPGHCPHAGRDQSSHDQQAG